MQGLAEGTACLPGQGGGMSVVPVRGRSALQGLGFLQASRISMAETWRVNVRPAGFGPDPLGSGNFRQIDGDSMTCPETYGNGVRTGTVHIPRLRLSTPSDLQAGRKG